MDRRLALGLTAASAVLWGTSFPVNDWGLAATDPWTFMAARFLIAFACTAALTLALGGLDASWLRSRWVWAVAVANALSYQVQFLGQELTTPGASALMVNAGNLAVPLFAFLVHGERVAGAKGPALLLGAAGVVLVGTRGDLAVLSNGEALGNLLTLVAGLSFALVIVLQKAALDERPAAPDARSLLSLVACVVGLTALFSLPGALLLGSRALPTQALLAAAYTGLFTTTIAFALWSAALRSVSSVTSGLVLLLEVVVAFGLSVALGLDLVTLPGLAGAACILAAIALLSLAPPGEPGTSPDAASP